MFLYTCLCVYVCVWICVCVHIVCICICDHIRWSIKILFCSCCSVMCSIWHCYASGTMNHVLCSPVLLDFLSIWFSPNRKFPRLIRGYLVFQSVPYVCVYTVIWIHGYVWIHTQNWTHVHMYGFIRGPGALYMDPLMELPLRV